MRAEVTTIHQALTPDAAAALTQSTLDAARRRHPNTTPIHVAAALLSSPSCLLRDACARSHSPLLSSHPLHCRALDLCFSIALDRLSPIAAPESNSSPPLSNALMAALKRAQAHVRRGCGDHVAVRVDLPHLVIAILDDPSVSRVMREASFSSAAAKALIESSTPNSSPNSNRPNSRNSLCTNSRLIHNQGTAYSRREEVRKVVEILGREKKRNPILVGDSDTDSVMKEVLLMIESRELGDNSPELLRFAKVVSFAKEFANLERTQLEFKVNELVSWRGGVLLDLGDLKWLVESNGGAIGKTARAAVAEMARLIQRFGEGGGNAGRVWVVGTATCATYLRCQVYHPTMESEWDIQAIPVAPRSPLVGFLPRSDGILSSSVEVLSEVGHDTNQCSSQWLQIATPSSTKSNHLQTTNQELWLKNKTQEWHNLWQDTRPFSPRIISHHQPLQCSSEHHPINPSCHSVKTDLVLGQSNVMDSDLQQNNSLKNLSKGLVEKVGLQPEAALAIAATVTQAKSGGGKRRGIALKSDTWLVFAGTDDVGKRNMAHALSRLVFASEHIAISLRSQTSNEFRTTTARGKTALDHVADALRQNSFRVVLLEDIDNADDFVRGIIKQAIETGRLMDSHGRELSLGSAIFILMSKWLPDDLKSSRDSLIRDEEKMLDLASSAWQLELSVEHKNKKRRTRDESLKDDRTMKSKKDSDCFDPSLDLNLAIGMAVHDDIDVCEGSGNSSDLTVENDQEYGQLLLNCSTWSSASELIDLVDQTVVFKPVDFQTLKKMILETMSKKFASIMENSRSIQVDDNVLDQMAGKVWLIGAATAALVEEWIDKVFVPGIEKLKSNLRIEDGDIVRLSSVSGRSRKQRCFGTGDWLSTSVTIAVDGNF
ncbi:protein SUPPRESSOR OF MAX2 1-like isoform X1 [Typha latifolia]|uniref:protein SUPPRESSOR OF MAX2 1-like isoform X1 n=1 Tax=Typha latifolia TaxID=4733 RepID=UPI003C30709B